MISCFYYGVIIQKLIESKTKHIKPFFNPPSWIMDAFVFDSDYI